VRDIVSCDELRGGCALVVDATGAGSPVVDMLAAARLGCELPAVVITGGDRGPGKGTVPKRDLMAGVQVLLEHRQPKIGTLGEGARLMRELGDMRTLYTGGKVRMDADGAGEHDDLVTPWRWLAGARKGDLSGAKVREDCLESDSEQGIILNQERKAVKNLEPASSFSPLFVHCRMAGGVLLSDSGTRRRCDHHDHRDGGFGDRRHRGLRFSAQHTFGWESIRPDLHL
jgi:hypothetical protein